MVFPSNILRQIRNTGKVDKSSKILMVVFCMFLANLFLFSTFRNLLAPLGLPVFVIILIQLILTTIVSVTIIRFFVIREQDKMLEHEASNETSLSSYYYLRNKEVMETVEDVPVFEYTDGNFCIGISLYYGANSDKALKGNEIIIKRLFNDCISQGFHVRIINMPEHFGDSIECSRYTSKFSKMPAGNLKDFSVEVFDEVLHYCENFNELQRTIILVKTSKPYQVAKYRQLIRKLQESFYTNTNSFRGLQFLDKESMRNFISEYYCLALDLSGLKSKEVGRDVLFEYNNHVKVIKLVTAESSKVFEEIKVRNEVKQL